jgi:hypothetical protein
MLDLTDVFNLVKDGFNQGSLFEERLVKGRVLDRLHVLAHLGDLVHLTCTHQINQPSGDILLIGIRPSK